MLPHFGAGTSAPPPLTQQPVSPGHTLEISPFPLWLLPNLRKHLLRTPRETFLE